MFRRFTKMIKNLKKKTKCTGIGMTNLYFDPYLLNRKSDLRSSEFQNIWIQLIKIPLINAFYNSWYSKIMILWLNKEILYFASINFLSASKRINHKLMKCTLIILICKSILLNWIYMEMLWLRLRNIRVRLRNIRLLLIKKLT